MLFYINGYFIVFIGCIYNLSEREMVRTTGRIKTGPNNVRRVVLALGEFFCFFFFFVLFYINGYFIVFIGCIYDLGEREMVRTTWRIKTGPKDVRCVIWALSEFFCLLFYINGCFIVFIGCIYDLGG